MIGSHGCESGDFGDVTDISIIIPVHNNAATLESTLRSVLTQSHGGWEVVVVDDGSTDDSPEVFRRITGDDNRFLMVRQENAGAGAARNTGLARASGDWVIFLDADDTLSSDHLATFLAAAAATPDAGLLHCGWRRRREGEPWWREHPAQHLPSPFAETARRCPFAIHSAMTRLEHVHAAGGFDPSLKICEDWDLWQRIARLGVGFAPVHGIWAEVDVRPRSLSSDSARHLADGLRVIERGHGPDPRIAGASPQHADGMPGEGRTAAVWWHVIWTLGALIGRGGDPIPLLDDVKQPFPAAIDAAIAAAVLEDGLVVGACRTGAPWPALWESVSIGIEEMLAWLDRKQPSSLPGQRIARQLENRIMPQLPPGVTATIGGAHQQSLDLGGTLSDLDLPGVSRFYGVIRLGDRELSRFDQMILGAISARTLAGEILSRVDPAILRPSLMDQWRKRGFFHGWRGPRGTWRRWRRLRERQGADAHAIQLADVLDLLGDGSRPAPLAESLASAIERITGEELRDALPATRDDDARHAAPKTGPDTGEEVDYTQEGYWEGIFSNKDPWDYRNNYEALKYDQTIDLIAGRRFGDALEIACAEGEFTRRLAALCDHVLATDIAPSAVARAGEKLADLPNISTRRLDLLTEDPPGRFDLIVCSEVLYYLDDAEMLARFARKVSEHLKPGGWFVTAHANLLIDEPDRTGFGWPHHFGAKGIGKAFATDPELTLSAEFWTPLYRIQRFEKRGDGLAKEISRQVGDTAHPLPARVAEQVRWRGGNDIPTASEWHDFPVLMYHRIIQDGPAGLAQWRTSPADFADQLAWLRDNGWQGVSLARMTKALHWNEPLPERCVMLTFDDATRDFMDHALPLLHRHGFPATLFAPTAKVGQSADWDIAHGDPASLLDWAELDALRHCDVAIASHGARHLPLTSLSTEAMIRELAGSKALLEARLGQEVNAIAYPFGDYDPFVRSLADQAGYKFGFTCFEGLVRETSDPLVLQRQEVRSGIGLEGFAALLGGR